MHPIQTLIEESFEKRADINPKNISQELRTALDDVKAMVATLTGYLIASQQNSRELYRLGLESVRFLLAVGDLLIGWLLQQQAHIAAADLAADPSPADRDFYEGKIAAAIFFATTVLPRLTADRGIVANTDAALMDVPEGAF